MCPEESTHMPNGWGRGLPRDRRARVDSADDRGRRRRRGGSGAPRRALEEVTTRRALHVHARGGTGVTEGLRARRSAHGTRWPWWLVGLLGSFRALRH